MKKNLPLLLASLVIAILFVLLQVVFIVREGEVAIVTFLGKPVKEVVEPGLYTRKPWPLNRVYRYDNRLQTVETSYEETLTRNGKNILVRLYAVWRIAEPTTFLERVGDVDQALYNLDGLLRAGKSAVVGEYDFSAFVNLDREALKLQDMEQRVLDRVAAEANERYGIEVVQVGLDRIGLPEGIAESVFARMRAERKELADRYRSEGEGEAVRIRAEADGARQKILAQASADAKRMRAEGEAEAAEYYKAFEADPELAMFLRNLDALEKTLKEKSTVVLDADSEPFRLLRGGNDALPQKAK